MKVQKFIYVMYIVISTAFTAAIESGFQEIEFYTQEKFYRIRAFSPIALKKSQRREASEVRAFMRRELPKEISSINASSDKAQ